MPSLFNRRSRSVSTSRPKTPVSSSAHAAAAQAFLANRQSQTHLSTSAAAAALRSMSPTPTPINQVQTKRMLSRQSSNASVGNAARGRSRTTVQRRTSNGSMTERTFRSPSPGRQPTSQPNSNPRAPPVPPLPETFATEDVPPIPQRSHRRSMSLENFSTRVASPPPTKRPQATPRHVSASNIAAVAASRSAAVKQGDELERMNSRNSYNFSYPRGSRPNSPPPQSSRLGNASSSEQSAVAKLDGISAIEAKAIQNGLAQTAAKPVKKNKKRLEHEAGEGTHLQNGSMNDQAGSIASPSQHRTAAAQNPSRPKTDKAKGVLSGEHSHFPDDQSNPNTDEAQQRRAQRAAGALAKQPSVVREDWAGEQETVLPSIENMPPSSSEKGNKNVSQNPTRTVQSKKPTTEANVSRKIEDVPRSSVHAPITTPPSSQAKKTLAPGGSEVQNVRQASVSPSRSFRFSDRIVSDLTAGRKHDPLPRSISPAKSALKHHSPSRSDHSPTEATFTQGSSVTPSESSEVSADVVARKKANRVSFEATAEVVGALTDVDITPQSGKDSSKRSWFAKTKKPSPLGKTTVDEDEAGLGMQPRPVLPSFGSVRKNRQQDGSPSPATRNTSGTNGSTGSLSAASSSGEGLNDLSTSNDRVVGTIINQVEKSRDHPLPPKVTTVDGTGYASDSESLSSDEENVGPTPVQQQITPGAALHYSDTGSKQDRSLADDSDAVPAISIEPATPGLDADASSQPFSDFQQDTIKAEHDPQQADDAPTNEHALNTIQEETDDDSLYDDAPEDSSDLEGHGFGSINAIVGSPVVKPSSSPPEPISPVQVDLGSNSETVSKDEDELSWDKSRAYWSGVSEQLRNNAQASEIEASAIASTKSKDMPSETAPASNSPSQPVTKIEPIAKRPQSLLPSPLEHSSTTQTKKNVRQVTNQNTLRNSTREQSSAGSAPPIRPRSMVSQSTSPISQPPAIAVRKGSNSGEAAPTKLRRTFSNESDSDSSFRRTRTKKPAGSGFARRTMRSGSQANERIPDRDVRSMSPVNRRPLSPAGPSKMRTSMRGAQAPTGPTLRNPPVQKRSSSLFSKARKAKSPTRASGSLGLGLRSQTRLVDSDDEDGPRAQTYRSRYADSSDEDEVENLRPVRGIPKRKDEGDSTDLEDSSDDQRRRNKPSTPKKRMEIKIPLPSSPLASEPMSPATAKKKGFWGRFRGKDREPNAQFTISERNKSTATVNGTSTLKTRESNDGDAKNAAQLGFKSTAERDALVAQTLKRLEHAQSPLTDTPGSSKRRSGPQRVLSDSWPLPPRLDEIPEDRPVTSAGAGEIFRPGMGERQPTSETLRTAGGTAVYGRNGKKKRFPRLRRVFGLTD